MADPEQTQSSTGAQQAGPREYDVVVIGAGPTGENVAARAVRGGLTAVLVEKELVGGECSYWACMPSKALLRPGDLLAQVRDLPGAAGAVTGDLDVGAVLGRRDEFTSNWSDESQVAWAHGADIDVVRGIGRLTGVKTVVVDTREGEYEIRARQAVVVATGTSATVPPIPGLREARPWTSREGTSAKEAPERLVVLGGGVVGCELATAWSSLGSKVTLVARGDALLDKLEPFAGELIADSLRSEGVDVRLGAEVTEVRRDGDGPTTVVLGDGSEVVADAVLVAMGRTPTTADIGLDAVGLEPGGYLEVDGTQAVTALVDGGTPWLYAAGDVNGRQLLTHMGKYEARCCGDAIAARAKGETVDPDARWTPYVATASVDATPSVVFTDPQISSVGRTAEAARKDGVNVKVVDYDIATVAGAALFGDGYTGTARIVVDEDRHVIVGACFAGRDTAELLHSATIAVVGEVPLERLWHAVPSYPTISEVWLRLLETYGL